MLVVVKKAIRFLITKLEKLIDPFIPLYSTKNTQSRVTLKIWFFQKVLGFNRKAYWPVHFTSVVGGPENILIGVDAAAGISHGCYIQGGGKIYIGDYVQVGPNVGIISANHNPNDNSESIAGEVKIGAYSWIGMNSVILPNTTLGEFTIVAAGSVVTNSFEEGYCVIGGAPAKKIRDLIPSDCIKKTNEYEYIGYIKKNRFAQYRKENLKI